MAENPLELAQYQSDHDLLILLNERVGGLTLAVSSKNEDHEKRIRVLEQKQWIIAGGLSVLAFVAPFIINYLFKR